MNRPGNRRILLIDDTESIHEDFRRILDGARAAAELEAAEEALFGHASRSVGSAGFELDSAFQGREGLEKVRASLAAGTPYALAFVDMRMPPGWDGAETIHEMWRVDPRLQVVICTAYSEYAWDELLVKLTVGDRLLILKKPFDNIEVAQLASALTTKWDMTRVAEEQLSRLEATVEDRTNALQVANQQLEAMVRDATHLATHDALTGLPNRLLFADRTSQALAVARRDGTQPVVLLLDLDGFKEVNDTLGHSHGDLLLTQIARRLSEVQRATDTVARFGGDEFVVLLTDGGPEAGAEVASRMIQALEAPFDLGTVTVAAAASIGIATTGTVDGETTLEELLRQADSAMYRAKSDRSGFAHFAAGDHGTPNRAALIGELRRALDGDEFAVSYQSQIAVGTGTGAGELVGVGAVVCWQHPTRGRLEPREFLAAVETSALAQRFTIAVLDQTLHFCRGCLDQNVRLPVSVTVGARALYDPAFPALIQSRLAHAEVPSDLLTIAFTAQSAIARPDLARRALAPLGDIGVRLSVTDHASSYSAIAALKGLPIDELRIDRSFLAGLTGDHHDAVIVQSAIDLGRDLGLSIVADGTEHPVVAVEAIGVDIGLLRSGQG